MRRADFLPKYIDAAQDSTDRTRRILLLMIVSSILVFTAYWNSRANGWVNNRLKLAKATEAILRNELPKENPSYAELRIESTEEDLYRNAREYAHLRTLEQAKDSLMWMQRIRSEQLSQIHVPGLGISFDVNDLGLLGGLTFIVLLIWVNYALWHHSTNLGLAFDFARTLEQEESGDEGLLFHTYQNLGMRQVLTIAPRPQSLKTAPSELIKILIKRASKLLYALPLLVQTIVVANDWRTHEVGDLVSRYATHTVLFTGTTAWVIILILTIVCFSMWKKAYNTWKGVAVEI